MRIVINVVSSETKCSERPLICGWHLGKILYKGFLPLSARGGSGSKQQFFMWQSLSRLIPSSLKKAGIAKAVSDSLVCEEFNKIATHILGGESEHCRAVYLKDRLLTVAVLSGSAANELKLYQSDILRALAERFGEGKVVGLRFMM